MLLSFGFDSVVIRRTAHVAMLDRGVLRRLFSRQSHGLATEREDSLDGLVRPCSEPKGAGARELGASRAVLLANSLKSPGRAPAHLAHGVRIEQPSHHRLGHGSDLG